MTRAEAGAFLDSLGDAGLTSLISELMWFQVTNKAHRAEVGTSRLADLRRIMADAAREHAIDRLTGEPATDPLPGRAP